MRSTPILRFCAAMVTSLAIIATVLPVRVNAISTGTLLALINQQRSAAGLSPLAVDSRLNASAMAKVQDMCNKKYWAHTSPSGLTPWYFIGNAGYPYTAVAENLAAGFSTDSSAVSAWMGSPGHRSNILNANFQDFGAGYMSCSFEGKQTVFIVAHFGAKATAPTVSRPPAPTTSTATPRSRPTAAAETPQSTTASPSLSIHPQKKVKAARSVKKPAPSVKKKAPVLKQNQFLTLLMKQLKPSSNHLFNLE